MSDGNSRDKAPRNAEYERYVEVFYVLEWRDDCIWRTESGGHRWVSETVVDSNLPGVTNVVYAAASDEYSKNNSTIRKKQLPSED